VWFRGWHDFHGFSVDREPRVAEAGRYSAVETA
jgi:hypothetical protein